MSGLSVTNDLFFFSWQEESSFPFAQVRLPPAPVDPKDPPVFTEGIEVEVYSRSNEREQCGWWLAMTKVRRPDVTGNAVPCSFHWSTRIVLFFI